MNRKNVFHLISLVGTILFSALTVISLWLPFVEYQPWFLIGGSSLTGISFIHGQLNEFNGVFIRCDLYVIFTIIISAIVTVSSILRAVNKISKYNKLVFSIANSGLSIMLAVCVTLFFIKLRSFNYSVYMNPTVISYDIGAYLYLFSGIMAALFALSLFFTDKVKY